MPVRSMYSTYASALDCAAQPREFRAIIPPLLVNPHRMRLRLLPVAAVHDVLEPAPVGPLDRATSWSQTAALALPMPQVRLVQGQPYSRVPHPGRAMSGAPTAPPVPPPAAHLLYRTSRSAMTHQPDRREAGRGLRWDADIPIRPRGTGLEHADLRHPPAGPAGPHPADPAGGRGQGQGPAGGRRPGPGDLRPAPAGRATP